MTTNVRCRSVVTAAFLLALAACPSWTDQRYLLSAQAVPPSIPADGRSYAQIVVLAFDAEGRPAPDGTVIQVGTTAGTVTPEAYVGSGRATAILTSTASPGVAIVTVSAGGAAATVQVEFASSDAEGSLGPKVLRMRGESLAYSVEQDTVLGSGGVTMDYRGLTISATNAQVCEPLGVIKAQGNVRVACGKKSLEGEGFVYDLRTDRCRMLTSEHESPAVLAFKADDLQSAAPSASANDLSYFAPLEADATKTWIISRKLALFPGEKIQFFRASIYLGGARVITLPHYFYDYRNRGSLMQQLRYTSYEGLVVDLPLYYRVADSSSGAIKLRYAGRGDDYGGYFRPRKGLSLGLEQSFSLGDGSDGRIFVDALGNPDQSIELTHHHEFGSALRYARADFTARFQPQSDFGKGLYTAYASICGGFGDYDYSISGFASGSRIRQWNPLNPADEDYYSQNDASVRLVLRRRRPLYASARLRVSPSLTVGYGRPGFGYAAGNHPSTFETFGLSFHTPASGRRGLSLNFDGASEITTTSDGRRGLSLRAGANLRRSWRRGSLSLGYTLNQQYGSVGSLYAYSTYALAATAFLGSGGKWNCYTYLNYGLDSGRTNLYTSGAFRLTNLWRFRTTYSLYRYPCKASGRQFISESSYLKAGVYRSIAGYEIGLAYSPNGRQAGFNDHKRFWLEVGAQGF